MVKNVSFMLFLISMLSLNAQDFMNNSDVNNDNIFNEGETVFSESNIEDSQDENNSTTSFPPDIPIPTRAPINDYLPLLAVAAVGLGFYYRKELNQITK